MNPTTLKNEQRISSPRGNEKDFTVIWQNLSVRINPSRWYSQLKNNLMKGCGQSLSSAGSERVILNQICGDIKSRQLTAIMGPSGAGKSTLLHCLFQNRTVGTSGRILVDSKSSSKLKVCFIPQHDYLNEWLTVREDLMFVSKLKLARVNSMFGGKDRQGPDYDISPSSVRQVGSERATTSIDHEANALHVADLLGLNNCLDVPIKKISGGQKKRLSIARELMSKPDILILDEPTTGLDSLTCYKTVMVLRDLVHLSPDPMAVVVTIHQPQHEVFNLFDKTYFISSTGQEIYDDDPRCAVTTIERVGQVKMPLVNYNPASFLIEIAADTMHRSAIEKLCAHEKAKFYKKYSPAYLERLFNLKSNNRNINTFATNNITAKSSSFPRLESPVSNIDLGVSSDTVVKVVDSSTSSTEDGSRVSEYYISHQLRNCLSSHSNKMIESFRHTFILTHRSWLSVIRNPTFTKSRLVFHTLLPLMMLAVFGVNMGRPNNCPKVEAELDIQEMTKSIKEGTITKNVEETRLCMENMSFFFILMYGFGINLISSTASFYPLTMHMFKKERINGLYSSAPYFLGQMFAELPLEIIFPSISVVLAYSLSGQISSFMEWRMFSIAYIVFLVCYSIHSLGLLCGAIFVNNVSVAVLFGQVLLLPFVMLSGFLIRPTRMPDWMRQLSWISPFKNGMSAVIVSRYGFGVCECDEDMIPEEGAGVAFSGMNANVKNVMNYMFPKNNESDIEITEVFDKLGQRFVKSQTFGMDIASCDDVRPYLMKMFGVDDTTLFYGIGGLIVIIIVYKMITFYIMKTFPYRIN